METTIREMQQGTALERMKMYLSEIRKTKTTSTRINKEPVDCTKDLYYITKENGIPQFIKGSHPNIFNVHPELTGDCTNVYGDAAGCTGCINIFLTGDLSHVMGDLSGVWGKINKDLYVDLTGITGSLTNRYGQYNRNKMPKECDTGMLAHAMHNSKNNMRIVMTQKKVDVGMESYTIRCGSCNKTREIDEPYEQHERNIREAGYTKTESGLVCQDCYK